MIQNLAIFGTVAAAAVCVAYALFMLTQTEEPQAHRPNRNRAPSPRRYPAGSLRRRNTRNSTYERIIEVIQSIHERTLVCPICRELIRTRERAWFCRSCSVGHHLTCVTQWAQSRRECGENFSCPNCRHVAGPPQNTCMCGRSNYPDINYSCGSTCQECTIECHPGPCL